VNSLGGSTKSDARLFILRRLAADLPPPASSHTPRHRKACHQRFRSLDGLRSSALRRTTISPPHLTRDAITNAVFDARPTEKHPRTRLRTVFMPRLALTHFSSPWQIAPISRLMFNDQRRCQTSNVDFRAIHFNEIDEVATSWRHIVVEQLLENWRSVDLGLACVPAPIFSPAKSPANILSYAYLVVFWQSPATCKLLKVQVIDRLTLCTVDRP
jgi:hypothetical protein